MSVITKFKLRQILPKFVEAFKLLLKTAVRIRPAPLKRIIMEYKLDIVDRLKNDTSDLSKEAADYILKLRAEIFNAAVKLNTGTLHVAFCNANPNSSVGSSGCCCPIAKSIKKQVKNDMQKIIDDQNKMYIEYKEVNELWYKITNMNINEIKQYISSLIPQINRLQHECLTFRQFYQNIKQMTVEQAIQLHGSMIIGAITNCNTHNDIHNTHKDYIKENNL